MSVLFIVLIESVAVCWLYGANKFSNQIKEMLGELPGWFWRWCWTFISPVFLFVSYSNFPPIFHLFKSVLPLQVIFIAGLVEYEHLEFRGQQYPMWSICVGWLVTLSSLSCIPAYGIYHLIRAPGATWREKISVSFNPSPEDLTLGHLCTLGAECPGSRGMAPERCGEESVPLKSVSGGATSL